MNKGKKPAPLAARLAGIIAPVVLPLTTAGEPDVESLRRQIDYLRAGGVNGLWMNGTTGEFSGLTFEESRKVVETAVKRVAGKIPVVAQVGDTTTRAAIYRAEQALDVGADYISVVLPYFLDYSQLELQNYLTAVSTAVQQPVILYQIPQMSKVSLALPGIIELTREGVLLGIKESSGNIEIFRTLLSRVNQEDLSLRCFNGSSTLMDAVFMVGGHGLVSGIINILPHYCSRIYKAAQAGDWQAVAASQEPLFELVQALRLPNRTNQAAIIGSYKWLLKEFGILATDLCFGPFEPFTRAERDYLREKALPLAQELCRPVLEELRGNANGNGKGRKQEPKAVIVGKG